MQKFKSAFTLIELSIVIVIIALLAGGVLFGKDMIAASEMRATVSQFDQFKSAVITFRNKYNALPGDMNPSKAAGFGLFTITGNCGSTCPYGNGFLDGFLGSPVAVYELHVFWRHLYQAGLIDEPMNSSLMQTSNGFPSSPPTGWQVGLMPKAKFTNNIYWGISGPGYRVAADGSNSETGRNDFDLISISPILAFALEIKIDDGKPNTGKMVDWLGFGLWDASPQDGNCTYGGAGEYSPDALYNIHPSSETISRPVIFISTLGFEKTGKS